MGRVAHSGARKQNEQRASISAQEGPSRILEFVANIICLHRSRTRFFVIYEGLRPLV